MDDITFASRKSSRRASFDTYISIKKKKKKKIIWFSPLDVYVTDVYARGVNVNLTPLTSKRGALATDVRGCSLWRYLLERPPPAWESRVRDPLGTRYEFGLCGPGRGCYIGAVTRMGVRFRGVNVTDVYARGVNVNLTSLTSKRGTLEAVAFGVTC